MGVTLLNAYPPTVESTTFDPAPYDYRDRTWRLQRIGGVAFLSVNDPTGLSANANNTCTYTIPSGYRPPAGGAGFMLTSSDGLVIRVTISANGAVDIYNYSSNTGTLNLGFMISWPIGG